MTKRKDNKYAKVEGLLRLYPEIERRKENAKQFMKLGEDRSKEIEELEIKRSIVENMMGFLQEKDKLNGTRDYDIIKKWYFDKDSLVAIGIDVGMADNSVWRRKKKIINKYLMSFIA